jgi:hypothetical protein
MRKSRWARRRPRSSGPVFAGGLIQLVTAPFAILIDALTFVVSGLMLRRIHVPDDVPIRVRARP